MSMIIALLSMGSANSNGAGWSRYDHDAGTATDDGAIVTWPASFILTLMIDSMHRLTRIVGQESKLSASMGETVRLLRQPNLGDLLQRPLM